MNWRRLLFWMPWPYREPLNRCDGCGVYYLGPYHECDTTLEDAK